MQQLGKHLRVTREHRARTDPAFTLRQVALRVGIQPSYLSKIERGKVDPPSEATIHRLAAALGEDADLLLAMAGKIASDLRDAVLERPVLLAAVIRGLRRAPDQTLLRLARISSRGRR
jgi:transcriptional regulator with XRE-family HTH domain